MIGITENDNGTKMRTKREIQSDEGALIEEIKAELEEIWQKIVDAAIDYCPKDTGALASTIESSTSGGGAISESPLHQNDFLNKTLIAGSDSVINPKTGKPTSAYAGWVHDGHTMPDGTFWNGVPFLAWALMQYEVELEEAVARAVAKIGGGVEPQVSE